MKRAIASSLLFIVAAMLLAGCATSARRLTYAPTHPGARTIALAITVHGVLQPTPAQYAAIQAEAVREFGRMGYVLVTDLTLAEQILRVNFTPSQNDPENSGRVSILGFRPNPYYASARNPGISPYPTSFGYAGSFSNTNWSALNQFGYGYYGYGNSYYDGYSYSSPTLNPGRPTVTPPTKTTPPFRHDHCPPESQRVQPLTGHFATAFTPVTPNNYPPSSSREQGRWRGGDSGSSTYAANGTSGSRSGASSTDSGSRSWRSNSSGSGDSEAWSSRNNSYSSNSDSDSRSWRGSSSSSSSSGDSGSRGSWRSDSSSSSSSGDRGYSRSDSGHSWSRGDSSSTYSRSDSSHSHSRSDSSSYSAPSSSSSSYSSASSSMSAASAPAASSSSSSGTSTTTESNTVQR